MPVKATDQWLLLYMVHSAVETPDLVYITYDVDFIPQATGDSIGLKPAYPIWLDVRPAGYPVFNVQRGYGANGTTCTWPREECAGFDPYGKVIPGQGAPPDAPGTDWTFPAAGSTLGRMNNFQGGTLIGIGGHLHPGGLTNDIDLVRNGDDAPHLHGRVRVLGSRRPDAAGRTADIVGLLDEGDGTSAVGRARRTR